MSLPRAIDLFSGCGGLTLGLRQAGFDVIAGIEIDTLAAETYHVNHPAVRIWNSDIRALSAPTIRKELGLCKGELELLAGCPPCQGFSSLRRLNGGRRVRDPKSKDLLFEFLRFVEELLPLSSPLTFLDFPDRLPNEVSESAPLAAAAGGTRHAALSDTSTLRRRNCRSGDWRGRAQWSRAVT